MTKDTEPRKDQFIIVDHLRELAEQRTYRAAQERQRSIDIRAGIGRGNADMVMDFAWALQQQANGLWDAAWAVNALELERRSSQGEP